MVNYRRYITQLGLCLENYKKAVDALAEKRKIANQKDEKEIEGMKGIYYPDALEKQATEMRSKTRNAFRDEFQPAQKAAKTRAEFYLRCLEKGLDDYYSEPIPESFTNRLMAYQLSGLTLSDGEFELLKKDACSYSAMRCLNSIAESRTKTEQKYTENGVEDVKVADPYIMQIPDMEEINQEFKNFKRAALRVVTEYSGAGNELLDCLPTDVDPVIAASGDAFFAQGYQKRFADVMADAFSIIPDGKPRELAPEEIAYIDYLITPDKPTSEYAAVKHAKVCTPEVRELLLLDPRYRDAILESERAEFEKEASA